MIEGIGYASEMGDDIGPSIEDQLRKLDSIIAEVGEVGAVLEDRLKPILRDDMVIKGEMVTGDNIVSTPDPNSHLYKYVQDQQKTMRRYVSELRDVVARIQL